MRTGAVGAVQRYLEKAVAGGGWRGRCAAVNGGDGSGEDGEWGESRSPSHGWLRESKQAGADRFFFQEKGFMSIVYDPTLGVLGFCGDLITRGCDLQSYLLLTRPNLTL